MELNEAIEEAIQHTRRRLAPPVSVDVSKLTAPALWKWRNDAFALAHFARAALPDDLADEIDQLIQTAASLARLLTEHADSIAEIKEYRSARKLGAGSDLVGFGEEYLSGEDLSLRDMLINGLSFYLNWKSNTAFIDAGEKAHSAMARSFLPEIQDELWSFMRIASGIEDADMTWEQTRSIASRIERAMGIIAQPMMPVNVQVALLAFLYHSLLRLRLGRLLIRLEQTAENA